jgi:sugar phosphate permease
LLEKPGICPSPPPGRPEEGRFQALPQCVTLGLSAGERPGRLWPRKCPDGSAGIPVDESSSFGRESLAMTSRRWLRIIPVALIMYTISYVDRTNVNLALTPKISSMLTDLAMDDRMKGQAVGIFFFGYVLLQIPGGHWAARWSARKVISLCLIGWGISAIGCSLARTFRQFEAARFLLGMAESGVFPAMLVLLANWFPRSERARS